MSQYILLINEIAELYFKEKKQQEIIKRKSEDVFVVFCEELRLLYRNAVDSLFQNYVEPFGIRYPFFLSPSSVLQVVRKERIEYFHSRTLEYILKSEVGSSVLIDFCNVMSCQAEWIKSISERFYTVENEYSTKKQRKQSLSKRRFDLFIKDDKNKWLIVLENKIDSTVHEKKGNQLDAYSEFCERTYPDYSKLYILLSLRDDNRQYVESRDWRYLDYYSVFNLLLKYAEEDDIIKDYLRTLYALLFSDVQLSSYIYGPASLFHYYFFVNRVILKLS